MSCADYDYSDSEAVDGQQEYKKMLIAFHDVRSKLGKGLPCVWGSLDASNLYRTYWEGDDALTSK